MSKTIVVKVGSSTLTDGTPHLSKPTMLEIVRQIAELHRDGHRMLLVTSGAVAAGRDHLGPSAVIAIAAHQANAQCGGSGAVDAPLQQYVQPLRCVCGAGFGDGATHYNAIGRAISTPATRSKCCWTIASCPSSTRMIPSPSMKSWLATTIICPRWWASLVNADLLLLLTDRNGVYDKDPRVHPDARHIPTITRIDDEIQSLAKRASSSGLGIGGMQTKLQAAEVAGRSGIETVIAHGSTDDIILRVVAGEELGTRIMPTAPRVESRKRWLLSEPSVGALVVDDGAAKVLLTGEASLLPVGLKTGDGRIPARRVGRSAGSDGPRTGARSSELRQRRTQPTVWRKVQRNRVDSWVYLW